MAFLILVLVIRGRIVSCKCSRPVNLWVLHLEQKFRQEPGLLGGRRLRGQRQVFSRAGRVDTLVPQRWAALSGTSHLWASVF